MVWDGTVLKPAEEEEGCKKMKKDGLVVRGVMVVVVAVVVVAVVVQLLLQHAELLLSTKALPAGLPLTHINFVRPLHTTVKLKRMQGPT